ncbi:MAG TPA: hypothetical protein VGI85_11635 [Chthoniobacterales bacterium]|jgi:lipopolysaccharide/colanic/teichoic acid biosynthesis glycosyltransferase
MLTQRTQGLYWAFLLPDHRQIRAGIQNRRFDTLKFRTMHPENHDLARQAPTEDERVIR